MILQPDGRLAVWSSYSDRWAVVDGSAEEVAGWFADRAAADARRDAGRVAELVLAGNAEEAYGRGFAMTFEEADAKAPDGEKAADIRAAPE